MKKTHEERLTLVCLDLVDSTKLVRQLGNIKSARLFSAHDRLTRGLLARFEGQEIDKTDGFLIVFSRTVNALNFAFEYRASVSGKTKTKARIGIHVGQVALTENRLIDIEAGAKRVEVDGIAKPICARVMSLARPNQILLSSDARQSCEFRLNRDTPNGVRFKVVGLYLLKGLSAPIYVHASGIEEDDFKIPKGTSKAKRMKVKVKEKERWNWRRLRKFVFRTLLYFSVCLVVYVYIALLFYPFAVDLLEANGVPSRAPSRWARKTKENYDDALKRVYSIGSEGRENERSFRAR